MSAQKTTIVIPEFRNLNPKDIYPVRSLVATYTGKFDILVAHTGFSNWVVAEQKTTVLAHKENGWYKMNITEGYIFKDTTTDRISIIKIDNTVGDSLWNIFLANHLFELEDERTKKPPGCSAVIFDADQHYIQIITPKEYKNLYVYAPAYYEEHCPGVAERKQLLNCLMAFGKYLGN